jgi:hypothetical protein
MVRGYLNSVDNSARQGEWGAMTDAATKQMRIVKEAKAEALEGLSKGLGVSSGPSPTYLSEHKGEEISVAPATQLVQRPMPW